MPEIKNLLFSHKEVAEALILQSDIKEGIWGLYIEFGISGANIPTGPNQELMPAAIIPVTKIGVQRFEKPSNLTVDASEIRSKNKKETIKKKKSA